MSFTQPGYGHRPPPGWQPPFPGPPPVPSGVNPQAWAGGRWQFNPHYTFHPGAAPQPPQHPHWVPGNGWPATQPNNQPAQAAASHNPYKRIPRAPSAEYMASKLSDNPLELHNMVPREEVYQKDGVPTTPWIWDPPGLARDDEEDGFISADFRDSHGRRIAQESRGPTPSRPDRPSSTNPHRDSTPPRRSSHDGGMSTPVRHDPSQSRQGSLDRPSPAHPHHPHHVSPLSRRGSQDQNHESLSRGPLPPIGRPTDPNSIFMQRFGPDASRSSTAPTPHTTTHPNNNPERSQSGPAQSRDNEAFTSSQVLRTTFSSKILVVPDYYADPSLRSSEEHVSSHPGDTPDTSSSLTPRMDRMNIGTSAHNAATLSRRSSEPVQAYQSSFPSRITTSNIVEEPASVLSPLIGATPKPSLQPALRGASVPDIRSLEAIPETSFVPTNQSNTTGGSVHYGSVRERRSTPGTHLAPLFTENISSSTPPRISTYTRERHHTPTPSPSPRTERERGSPYSRERHHTPESNPLPRPPSDIHSSPLVYGPPARVPTPPPGTWTRRTRLGFWNRRGDHLTMTGHIVYAPPVRANPAELRDYPDERDGYLDHHGSHAPFNPDRPELPESLPRHGRPPVYPYDSWVVHRYT